MQIKVIDTKMHQIIVPNWNGKKEVPVSEGKLVLVEERGIHDFRSPNDGGTQLKGFHVRLSGLYWKPIIISETEKTEVGDKVLVDNRDRKTDPVNYSIETVEVVTNGWIFTKEQPGLGQNPDWTKKILALPEHFSPKHLQAIVDGKMKDGDKVLVECIQAFRKSTKDYKDKDYIWLDNEVVEVVSKSEQFDVSRLNQIKLNSSNHIMLHKVEEKMYTREELGSISFKAMMHGIRNSKPEMIKYPSIGVGFFDEWFEQNVK